MRVRSVAALAAALALAVSVPAAERGKGNRGKNKGKQGTSMRTHFVGNLICGKCEFSATSTCSVALKLSDEQFVLLGGKVADELFGKRKSGELVRVNGKLSLKDGMVTLTGNQAFPVQNKKAPRNVRVTGDLVCSHCAFGVGKKCGVGLRVDGVHVVLEGDATKAVFANRKNGERKMAVGLLAKIERDTIYLKVNSVDTPTRGGGGQRGGR